MVGAIGASLGVAATVLGLGSALIYPRTIFYYTAIGSYSAALVNNDNCVPWPDVEACEKLVLHAPSGHVYSGCSTISARESWLPFNLKTGDPYVFADYIAVYEPDTKSVRKLAIDPLSPVKQIWTHGMDVVISDTDPEKLYLYIINHRPQPTPVESDTKGADSVIEVFETRVGGSTLKHIKTYHDPEYIITPNDIQGTADGKSFYLNNDGIGKSDPYTKNTLLRKMFRIVFDMHTSSTTYCQESLGCKFALSDVQGLNGIAQSKLDPETLYIASTHKSAIDVYQKQSDQTLVWTDRIDLSQHGCGLIDNIVTEEDDSINVACIPHAIKSGAYLDSPRTEKSPVKVLRVSKNSGRDAYFGAKYNISTLFANNGEMFSLATTGVYDAQRRKLHIAGLLEPRVLVCSI